MLKTKCKFNPKLGQFNIEFCKIQNLTYFEGLDVKINDLKTPNE